MPLSVSPLNLLTKEPAAQITLFNPTGESGSAKAFTVTEASTSVLATDIPTGFSADASVSVNGLTSRVRPTA